MRKPIKLKDKSILCSTTDAGAALYASPIVKKLRENNQVDIYAGPHGSLVLTQNGVFHKPLNNEIKHAAIARSLVRKKKYDLFLRGTNLGPSLEKELTLLGKSHGIPTIAFIDHFSHPWQRFAQLEEQKKNVFLPNDIWVIDRWVKDRLIENCVPSPIIKIAAHPYLKTLKKRSEKTNRSEMLRKLEIPQESKIITIASEPPPTGKIAWASEELSP